MFRRVATAALVALLLASCGGSEPEPLAELPVPAGLNGGCSPELLAALRHHDVGLIRSLRARGAVGNCHETTWMMWDSVMLYRTDDLKVVLSAGADPNDQGNDICRSTLERALLDRKGWTAATLLTADAPLAIARLLLEAGADPNTDLGLDNPSLIVEVPLDSPPVRSCFPRAVGEAASPMKPLVFAAATGDVELAELLIAHGADLAGTDSNGRTAPDYAPVGIRPQNREPMASLLRDAATRRSAETHRTPRR